MAGTDFFTPSTSLDQIHEGALRVLSEIGFWTDHTGMRDRLAAGGCRIYGERVLVPPGMSDAAVRSIPRSFVIAGRDPLNTLRLAAGGPTYFTNTGILPNLYDFDTGVIRRSTLTDVVSSTRLLDALPHVDAVYVSLLDATELPPRMVTVTDFAATLANTTKPLVGPGVTSGAEALAVTRMASAIRRGAAGPAACVPFVCPITPLRFPADLVDAIIVVAEAGLPLNVVTNPVMGVTSPYTIAGTVMLGHAELIATALLAHAIRPDLPILNQNTPSIADMRSLNSTTGGPETGLIRRLVIELSNHLGIPSCAHGHTSSARLDLQAGDEKTLNLLLIASAGPALLGGLGGLANVTLASYETVMTDHERLGMIRRALEGVAVDAERLGFEAIRAAVGGGDILGHEHTLSYLRSAEVARPVYANRAGLVDGQPELISSVDKAREDARRLLASHTPTPLAPEIRSEIDKILQEYEIG